MTALPRPAQAAGIYTHSVFVEQAIEYLNSDGNYSELVNILNKYPDTVNFGASFPDALFGNSFIPTIDGDWAEFVHDTKDTRDNYTNYLDYLTDKGYDRSISDLQTGYYKAFLEDPNYTAKIPVYRAALMGQMGQYFNASPRSFEDEKKIAFLFGLIAHQEADLAWHWTPDPNWVPLEKAAKDLYGKDNADYDFEMVIKQYNPGNHAEFTYASYIEQDVLAASDASFRRPSCYSPCVARWGNPILTGAYNLAVFWDDFPAIFANGDFDQWIKTYVPGGIEYGSALVAGAWMQTWDWFKAPTPITEIVLSSAKPAGSDKWYQGPVTITLKAGACFKGMDTTMGPCQTYYKLNSDTNFQEYTEPIQISSQGTTNLYYYSADAKNSDEVHRKATIKIHLTSPTITAAATVPPNANGWYNRDVTIHFTCSATLSGIPAGACPADQTLSSEGMAVQSTAETVQDAAGNVSSLSNVVTVKIDKSAPTLNPVISPNPVLLNSRATIAANASDAISGVASQACGEVDTRTLGKHTVTCTTTDRVGNTVTQTITYTVNYDWIPSFDAPPTVNTGKAGLIYPVKWQLTDANGTFISDLSAIRTPGVYAVQCGSFSSNPTSALESSRSDRAGLRYNRGAHQFIYNWSTPTKPGCYKLVIKLKGGQSYPVYFNLK